MSTGYEVGYLVGMILAFAVMMAIFIFIGRKFIGKCNYDERQELIRGRGYKYAFLTTIVGQMIVMVADITIVNTTTQIGFVLFASIAVYAVYCVINDAYFGLEDKRKRFLIIDFILLVVNAAAFISNYVEGEIDMTESTIPNGILNLYCALLFAVIGIAIGVKAIAENRKGGSYEESEA